MILLAWYFYVLVFVGADYHIEEHGPFETYEVCREHVQEIRNTLLRFVPRDFDCFMDDRS